MHMKMVVVYTLTRFTRKRPWDQTTCLNAFFKNKLECFKYAYENGCPFEVYSFSMHQYNNKQSECYKYLREKIPNFVEYVNDGRLITEGGIGIPGYIFCVSLDNGLFIRNFDEILYIGDMISIKRCHDHDELLYNGVMFV